MQPTNSGTCSFWIMRAASSSVLPPTAVGWAPQPGVGLSCAKNRTSRQGGTAGSSPSCGLSCLMASRAALEADSDAQRLQTVLERYHAWRRG